MSEINHLTNFGFSYKTHELLKENEILKISGTCYRVIGACGLFNTNNFDEEGNEVEAFLELEKLK